MLEGGHEPSGKREQFRIYFRVSHIEAARIYSDRAAVAVDIVFD